MTSHAAGCLRCKEKKCSVNEFYFTTLKAKCHLVFLNQIKSDLEPLLNWIVRNSVPKGFPGVQWGRGWQRLRGSWKSTCWHSEGSLQSRTSMPGHQCPQKPHSTTPSGLLRDSGLHRSRKPPSALPSSFHSQEAWGLSPELAVFPYLPKDIFPTCPLGKTLHILPQQVLRNTMVTSLSWIGGRRKSWGKWSVFLIIYPASLLIIISANI